MTDIERWRQLLSDAGIASDERTANGGSTLVINPAGPRSLGPATIEIIFDHGGVFESISTIGTFDAGQF